MDDVRRRAGELAHQVGDTPTLAGILQGRGAGRFAEPRLMPTQYAPGERESTNIEDRRFPIRSEFGPLSLQQLLEQYNGLIQRPTDMNMERAQAPRNCFGNWSAEDMPGLPRTCAGPTPCPICPRHHRT